MEENFLKDKIHKGIQESFRFIIIENIYRSFEYLLPNKVK